jgi:hypothetical protein
MSHAVTSLTGDPPSSPRTLQVSGFLDSEVLLAVEALRECPPAQCPASLHFPCGALGLDPPEVQPWDFADATGRSRWIKPE